MLSSRDTREILHLEKLLLTRLTLVSSRSTWEHTACFAQDEGFLFCQAYVSSAHEVCPVMSHCHQTQVVPFGLRQSIAS